MSCSEGFISDENGKVLDNRGGSSMDAAVTAVLSNLHNVFSLKEEHKKKNSTKGFSSLPIDFGESLMENCITVAHREGGGAQCRRPSHQLDAIRCYQLTQRAVKKSDWPALIGQSDWPPPSECFHGLFFFFQIHT